jgi:hypothetical protein
MFWVVDSIQYEVVDEIQQWKCNIIILACSYMYIHNYIYIYIYIYIYNKVYFCLVVSCTDKILHDTNGFKINDVESVFFDIWGV